MKVYIFLFIVMLLTYEVFISQSFFSFVKPRRYRWWFSEVADVTDEQQVSSFRYMTLQIIWGQQHEINALEGENQINKLQYLPFMHDYPVDSLKRPQLESERIFTAWRNRITSLKLTWTWKWLFLHTTLFPPPFTFQF